MDKKKVLITGVTGQDGAILADILSSKGFMVRLDVIHIISGE